ncbi:MAG TPA: cytochrome d ubiquinol oxidase subunit II [Stellaceae bacterium]|jgi:cytochrome d ubiquinol oxidase subunit II|nr:cytochrome d ubiquinol oxidase subunit II [Stellaceae bacterium]
MDSTVHLLLVDVWLCFLGLFLTFYVVLDGFDLGIGVLSLFVREEERRGIMVASLGSVWDANESWLVVLGGALFGAFPLVYGVLLNALYLPITVMIFALIFRGVAFEYREQAKHRQVWNYAFGLGSLIAALCQGFALGGLIAGPSISGEHFTGGPFDWLSSFSVLVAFGVVFGYVLLGATYLIIKTEGEAQKHAIATAWISGALMLIAAAGISLWTPIRYPFIAEKWFGSGVISAFVIPPLFAIVCSLMLARALIKRQETAPFIWSVGIFLCSLSGLAASFYPYLIPRSVTVEAAASDSLTLVIMMLGIGLLIPVMIVYNAYQYIVFRGKVSGPHYGS